jgi:hypothetical protein
VSDSIILRQPVSCPKCGSKEVKRIFYGRPGVEALEKATRGEAVLGGCFVRPRMDDWHCGACSHAWFDADDPAKKELEELLASILAKADVQRKNA